LEHEGPTRNFEERTKNPTNPCSWGITGTNTPSYLYKKKDGEEESSAGGGKEKKIRGRVAWVFPIMFLKERGEREIPRKPIFRETSPWQQTKEGGEDWVLPYTSVHFEKGSEMGFEQA